MLSTTASFALISKNVQSALDRVAAQPVVSREVEYYSSTISSIKSIDDFMADDRIFRFAMKAFGLEEMSYAKGMMRKLLEEGTDNRESLANTLVDPRYREFASTFNFVRYESSTTSFTDASSGVVDRYIRQTLEIEAAESDEGVRLALYFQRKAPEIENAFQILADRALLAVVRTALNIPDAASSTSIEKQAAEIEKRLDIEDLKSPEKLGQFLQRFTTLWGLNNPSQASSAAAGLAGLGAAGSAPIGIDVGTLMSLQQLKLRS